MLRSFPLVFAGACYKLGMVSMMRRLESGVAASFDRAIYNTLLTRSERSRMRSRAESMAPEARIEALRELAAQYDDSSLYSYPDRFFAPPSAPIVEMRRRGSFGRDGDELSVRWLSRYELHSSERDLRARYLGYTNNDRVYARYYTHRDRPRATVILIHGYMGGQFIVESRMWPLGWLFDQGLDIVLALLPFHGLRGRRIPVDRPPLPHTDPRFTIEGFRQAMWDLRGLVRWLESRGVPHVGAMGMSLGGYTTALLSTVESKLAFAVPHIPLAAIEDFAREGGRLNGTDEQKAEQHRLLTSVYRVVSPLARPSRVEREGRLVIGARSDRIVPLSHAERLAAHLESPLEVIHGGHLMQFGRRAGFQQFRALLDRTVFSSG